MEPILRWLARLPSNTHLQAFVYALAILVLGFLLAAVLPKRLPISRLHPQHQLVVRRLVKYALVVTAVAWSLRTLGVSFSVLLGTAGLLTVAIGFAAQTSASNLISGLFLMAEQPFVIGDTIEVGNDKGEVVSVDLLSVRLRTVDNLLVRIPNETMLKSNVKNLTHFPIRRCDMKIGVSYREDLQHVRAVLLRVAERSAICLEEPKPRVLLVGFGESSVDLELLVWATRERFIELRSGLYEEVLRAFDAEGILIPYPHRTVVMGEVPVGAEGESAEGESPAGQGSSSQPVGGLAPEAAAPRSAPVP